MHIIKLYQKTKWSIIWNEDNTFKQNLEVMSFRGWLVAFYLQKVALLHKLHTFGAPLPPSTEKYRDDVLYVFSLLQCSSIINIRYSVKSQFYPVLVQVETKSELFISDSQPTTIQVSISLSVFFFLLLAQVFVHPQISHTHTDDCFLYPSIFLLQFSMQRFRCYHVWYHGVD
jgi:hypothetical protein